MSEQVTSASSMWRAIRRLFRAHCREQEKSRHWVAEQARRRKRLVFDEVFRIETDAEYDTRMRLES